MIIFIVLVIITIGFFAEAIRQEIKYIESSKDIMQPSIERLKTISKI